MCLLTDVVFFRDGNLVDCLTVTIYLQPIYGAESLAEVTVTVAPIIISLVSNTLTYCWQRSLHVAVVYYVTGS